MILQPGTYFPIIAKTKDQSDTTVYYPQAVIRNASTMAVIETVDLASQGGGFYLYSWQVPMDPSGQGFYIEITRIFYNDAGHTDSATPYVVESTTYLIHDRMLVGGHGGGADVDYKRIRKMIQEELALLKFPEFPIPEKLDLLPILSAIANLPVLFPTLDLTSLTADLKRIEDKIIPPEKAIDVRPQLEAFMQSTQDIIARLEKTVENTAQKNEQVLSETVKANVEGLLNELKQQTNTIGEIVLRYAQTDA